MRPICRRNFSLFTISFPSRSASRALSIASTTVTALVSKIGDIRGPESRGGLTTQFSQSLWRFGKLLKSSSVLETQKRVQFVICAHQLTVGYPGDIVCISVYCVNSWSSGRIHISICLSPRAAVWIMCDGRDKTYTALVFVSSFSSMRTGSFSLPAAAAGLACLTGVVD